MTTTNHRPDQIAFDAHNYDVEPVSTSLRASGPTSPKEGSPAGATLPADQDTLDAHPGLVGGANSSLRANSTSMPIGGASAGNLLPASHRSGDTHSGAAGGITSSLRAIRGSTPNCDAPVGDLPPASHGSIDTHSDLAGGITSSLPANLPATPISAPLEGNQTGNGSAAIRDASMPMPGAFLVDPFLDLAADVLDDTERTKIANENRLRQLTRSVLDSDGEERGFGLDETHPDVENLAALVDLLGQVEHQAVLQLQRKMRAHPLGPWIKTQKGVGDKQAARLLATIGDPYWNTLHDRPRTVSELWAYCGLHTLPAGQGRVDTQPPYASRKPDLPAGQSCGDTHVVSADGESSPVGGDPSQWILDIHPAGAGVAARRRKGQKANWSSAAKSRAYLIAESMLRAGNREVYDRRKTATEGRLHAVECVRCGPKGKPALPGSPWSDGHRHADALRIVSKELLKELWREARRLHEEMT